MDLEGPDPVLAMTARKFCMTGFFFKKTSVLVESIWLTVLHTGAVCVLVVYAMDMHTHLQPMTLLVCSHFILEGLC